MFFRLHRLAKLLVWMLLLGVFVFVWQQRAVLEPLLLWYQVIENGGIEIDGELPIVEGRAQYISDGHTFRIKTSDGTYYLVRLAGLNYPPRPLSALEMGLEKQRREALQTLVLSNWVHVEVAYSSQHSLLGIVHVGTKVLNFHFITNGLATLNRDYIKRMPRQHQYEFFSAARAFEKRQGTTASQVARVE